MLEMVSTAPGLELTDKIIGNSAPLPQCQIDKTQFNIQIYV